MSRDGGQLYTWGNNTRGLCGLGDQEEGDRLKGALKGKAKAVMALQHFGPAAAEQSKKKKEPTALEKAMAKQREEEEDKLKATAARNPEACVPLPVACPTLPRGVRMVCAGKFHGLAVCERFEAEAAGRRLAAGRRRRAARQQGDRGSPAARRGPARGDAVFAKMTESTLLRTSTTHLADLLQKREGHGESGRSDDDGEKKEEGGGSGRRSEAQRRRKRRRSNRRIEPAPDEEGGEQSMVLSLEGGKGEGKAGEEVSTAVVVADASDEIRVEGKTANEAALALVKAESNGGMHQEGGGDAAIESSGSVAVATVPSLRSTRDFTADTDVSVSSFASVSHNSEDGEDYDDEYGEDEEDDDEDYDEEDEEYDEEYDNEM